MSQVGFTDSRCVRSYTFSTTAEVLVGPDKVKFVVYPTIICKRCPFLKAALAKQWNPNEQPIELPEDDPHIFDTYLACA